MKYEVLAWDGFFSVITENPYEHLPSAIAAVDERYVQLIRSSVEETGPCVAVRAQDQYKTVLYMRGYPGVAVTELFKEL